MATTRSGAPRAPRKPGAPAKPRAPRARKADPAPSPERIRQLYYGGYQPTKAKKPATPKKVKTKITLDNLFANGVREREYEVTLEDGSTHYVTVRLNGPYLQKRSGTRVANRKRTVTEAKEAAIAAARRGQSLVL